VVFLVSAILALVFVGWGSIWPAALGDVANLLMDWITYYFGWWYLLVVFGFLIFIICLLISPYGRIRLGKDDERPEWTRWSWFSMLFTAGMGIGLVFFGVYEPVWHFTRPPDPGVAAGSAEAARQAMHLTYFHWGLHPWAIYLIIGLAMGYFCFRHDLPLRPAAALYPLVGNRIHGWVGNLVDILAVFGTLFGLATSLGLGAKQINTGLSEVFGVPDVWGAQLVIIAVVTSVAVTSVVLGLSAGVRRLSVINMYLAILLAAVVFVAGPTVFILEYLVQSIGYYLDNLIGTSMQLFALESGDRDWTEGREWKGAWTLFYWGWWCAWSPFVGMFIARVSRGRTIREFILGCLFAPVGASMAWFAILGGSAIHAIREGGNEALAGAGKTNAMFVLMEQLPIGDILATGLSLLAILVVAIFFATSSDSGSLVVDMLTNGGDPQPRWQQRFGWAVLQGVIAAVLLVAGAMTAAGTQDLEASDALNALQTAAVTAGLPFSVVLVFMCWGLVRQLKQDRVPPSPVVQAAHG
jgi:choline/glycine/proline betaine transport protein